mgnify:CR=1 FL=1
MIKDKKTAIVGGIVGCVILLTIFCCEGNKEAVEAAPVEAAVEEVVPAVEEVIEEVTPEVEETPAVEEVIPEEIVE